MRIDVPAGTVFGRLTVTGETRTGARNVRAMACRCECGQTKVVDLAKLRSGHTASCGCLRFEGRPRPPDPAADIPPGTVFGRLAVIEPARTPHGQSAMLCQCECGKMTVVVTGHLRSGHTKSCGCLCREDNLARLKPGEVPLHGKKAAGRVALVDDEDYDLVMQYRWRVDESERKNRRKKHGPYAMTAAPGPKPHTFIRMHTLITGWAQVDHRDGNGLNNRRSNLRDVTGTQNNANQRKRVGQSLSRYKGVTWHHRDRRWRAQIKDGSRRRYLGNFINEDDAARAYDAAALAAWGEFALINFPAAARLQRPGSTQ